MLPSNYNVPDVLSQSYLYDLLSCFAVQDSPYFDRVPDTVEKAADEWFNATWNYFMCLSSPPLIFADIHKEHGSLVKGVMETVHLDFRVKFEQMGTTRLNNNLTILASCFTDFTKTVRNLFASVYTSVTTIPVINLEPVRVLGMSGGSGKACMELMSLKIHEHFISNSSTMTAEPFTTFTWI